MRLRTKVVAAVSMSLAFAAAPGLAQETAEATKVSTGIVEQAEKVDLQSEAASATAPEQPQDSFETEATECYSAKQALIEAKTAEELDLAQRQMSILCSE